jgi:hypothetical protein
MAGALVEIWLTVSALSSLIIIRLNARTVGPIHAGSVYSLDHQWSCRLRP